jgi:hypothetical protein
MEKDFVGYYRPNDDELIELWGKCTFVLDANVILNLYRYPAKARNDLLKILNEISGRLWIPYQVALEYQENRLRVIGEQRKKFSEVKEILTKIQNTLETNLGNLQLKKRHSSIKPDDLLKKVKADFDEFLESLEASEQKQPNVSDHDTLRDEIDTLLEGRIGAPPQSQEELDKLYQEGQKRFEAKWPPGYMDEREKSEPETYVYGGLVYKRKYGDLILWHQIIEAAKTHNEFKYLIFVTDDDKEDWWWIVDSQGKKTIGPRPELVEEISSKAGVVLFYMYSSERFTKFAKEYLKIEVQDKSIEQIRDIAEVEKRKFKLRDGFEITNKSFDDTSDPQKIVIRFTNTGYDPIQVRKILYSDKGLGLPQSALSTSYQKESRGRYNIPFNPSQSEVLPGENFFVELHLAQIWLSC